MGTNLTTACIRNLPSHQTAVGRHRLSEDKTCHIVSEEKTCQSIRVKDMSQSIRVKEISQSQGNWRSAIESDTHTNTRGPHAPINSSSVCMKSDLELARWATRRSHAITYFASIRLSFSASRTVFLIVCSSPSSISSGVCTPKLELTEGSICGLRAL